MTPRELEKNQKFWLLVLFIPLAIGVIWVLVSIFSVLLGFGSVYGALPFEDDFEAYDLGHLYGQGSWTKDYTYGASVIDNPVVEGVRGIETNEAEGLNAVRKIGTPVGIGEIYFYAKFPTLAQGYFFVADNTSYPLYLQFNGGESQITIDFKDGCVEHSAVAVVNIDEWVEFGISWNKDTDKSRYLINGVWSEEYNCVDLDTDLDRIVIYGEKNYYLDFISSTGELPPTEPVVWGIDPISGTGITNLETFFEFGWAGLDNWDTLSVVFQNRDTGIFTEAQELLITTSPSGSEVFNFSNFNPDRNGVFYFFATATRSVPETIQGMFLTGRWSYEWTEDIVDPEYWIEFNIEGLTPIFNMSDFSDYYGSISKFAIPTDMAVAITGFFEPIFQKIGEFGNRITDYFDVNEAYAQGYEIGKSVPYFTYFIGQLTLFLGGFPIIKWVFVLILLLVGVFMFRLIMKFIPFLGN